MVQQSGFGDMLVGLAILIQRRYAQICCEHDLTTTQAQLLCSIKDQPRRMTELAAHLGMAKPALSQLVDRTERRDLVHRQTSEQDRRVITLAATPEGKRIADALFADVAARLPDIAGDLGPDDQEQLARLATAIVGAHLPGLISGADCPLLKSAEQGPSA